MSETTTAAPPALTLQRPWGFAIVHLGKDVENRTWPTKHRGPLFIHQGKATDRDAMHTPAFAVAFGSWHARPAVTQAVMAPGVILGWVTLTGCHQAESGCCSSEWALPGQWHWMLADPRVREIDPLTASRVMQAHYDAEHGVDLVRLGYGNADPGE